MTIVAGISQGSLFSTVPLADLPHWQDWLTFLRGELRYPDTQIRHAASPDLLLVFADERRSHCLLVISRSEIVLTPASNEARFLQGVRPAHVIVGTPARHDVAKWGTYGLSESRLHRIPSWTHSFRRDICLSREHALLSFSTEEAIRSAVSACHNAIYSDMAKDPAAAFDILSLVIAAKMLDETKTDSVYRFWSPEEDTDSACAERLISLLHEAAHWLAIGRLESIAAAPPSQFGSAAARTIFDEFQPYSVTETSTGAGGADILGLAYERMVGATFRGDLGSYFTPRTIADFMVRMLDVRRGKILDPACGSGGLLTAALRFARAEAESGAQLDPYGNDLNPRMVQAARVNFLVHNVSRDRIRQGDGLDYESMLADLLDRSISNAEKFLWDEEPGPFDFVLANPPFAGRETNPRILSRIQSAENGAGTPRSLHRTLPFLEVILASLREGGTAGLVIPTSILNAEEKSFRLFRELLLERAELLAIIGLPEKAFVHTDCGIHGVLLFFRRARRPRTEYDIFVGWADHLGYDRLGRPTDVNDFPNLQARFRSQHWLPAERVSVSTLRRYGRWDPAWLRVVRKLPNPTSGEFVCLGELLEIRQATWSRRNIVHDRQYQYFEVSDCDVRTGRIKTIHEVSGTELFEEGPHSKPRRRWRHFTSEPSGFSYRRQWT